MPTACVAPAALALTAALFHVFNHSVFKSLLFFGSGAVLTATGERDMERLGGLIHRMPFTAFAFLIGSAAISALPPFNGFVSEWLTFQAILLSPQLPQWVLKFLAPAVGAMLALSAALAAACFVKAFGITFLGRPRTSVAQDARETDAFSLMRDVRCWSCLCLVAGILPGYFIDALAPVAQTLVGAQLPQQTALSGSRSSRSQRAAAPTTAFCCSCSSRLPHGWRRMSFTAGRRTPCAGRPSWDCGFPDASPATQYTAGSFAQPIRRVFGTLVFHAREEIDMPPPGDSRPARLHVHLRDLVWDALYAPVARGVGVTADGPQPGAIPDAFAAT